jgi:hypothetical protein
MQRHMREGSIRTQAALPRQKELVMAPFDFAIKGVATGEEADHK